MYLQQFDYNFIYKTGKTHLDANALSRIPDNIQNINTIIQCLSQIDIKAKQSENSEIIRTIETLKQGQSPPPPFNHQEKRLLVLDDVLYRKIHTSTDDLDRLQLVLSHYTVPSLPGTSYHNSGHFGLHKTHAGKNPRKSMILAKIHRRHNTLGPRLYSMSAAEQPPSYFTSSIGPIETNSPFEKLAWPGPYETTSSH